MNNLIETMLVSRETDFKESVLGVLKAVITQTLIEDQERQTPPNDPHVANINPYVVYANTPQNLVFRRSEVEKITPWFLENILMDTLLLKPAFLAVSMDGFKTKADDPESLEACSYLVFVFLPSDPWVEIHEIEYGPEDGGWVSDPVLLDLNAFSGPLRERYALYGRLLAGLRSHA